MESLIFEKEPDKILINALRISGHIEYDSELADIGDNKKIFIVTDKVNKNNEEDKVFKYGISKIIDNGETGLEKLWNKMIEEIENSYISNITKLPLYYLLDYKNIVSTDNESMKNSMKINITDKDTDESIKNKYIDYHMKEIVKNMKNSGYLNLENIELNILIKNLSKFLEEILKSYIYVGMQFYNTFKDLTIENLDKDIELYPNCKELQEMKKSLITENK